MTIGLLLLLFLILSSFGASGVCLIKVLIAFELEGTEIGYRKKPILASIKVRHNISVLARKS